MVEFVFLVLKRIAITIRIIPAQVHPTVTNQPMSFREEDDLARRTLHIMDTQVSKMHTRLRDGTCIPFMSLFLPELLDKPTPAHTFMERPLLKYTWDETYEEAYEQQAEPKLAK